MTFSSSLSRRDSNGEVEMFRPGRPGFSGTKLKLNQRSMLFEELPYLVSYTVTKNPLCIYCSNDVFLDLI